MQALKFDREEMVAESGKARQEAAPCERRSTHSVAKIPNRPIEPDQQGATSHPPSEHDTLRRGSRSQDFADIMIVEPTGHGNAETKLAREPRRITQGCKRPAPFGIGQIDEVSRKELDVGHALRMHGPNRIDLRHDSNTGRDASLFEGTQYASECRSSHTGIDRRSRPGGLMALPDQDHPIGAR